MKNQTNFKDELRKSLKIHALAPCFIFVVVIILVSILTYIFAISAHNRNNAEEMAETLENVFVTYKDAAVKQCDNLKVQTFEADTDYRVDTISEVCRFINSQKIKGEFYLFDEKMNCVYTTQKSQEYKTVIKNQVKGKRNSILEDKKEFIYIYESYDTNQAAVSAYIIFVPIYKSGELQGFGGYVIHLNQIEHFGVNGIKSYLVINSFNRVLLASDHRFENERGKLIGKKREDSGFQFIGNNCYYFYGKKLTNPALQLYSYTECTAWYEMMLMLLGVTILAGVLLVLTIRKSTRRFADKKTKIIYELIDALEQVEQRNFDVTLDIQSNDEFQYIGSSFNMMISSIRQLIEQQQEMAREQMVAHIQVMESQFNPHFLFNTLEAIRYMVLIDPQAVQDMIVKLSKLLRYSIKGESETVRLQQEIDFLWNYAEIMQVRYGKKLSVEIITGEDTENLVVPRMIIQPLVENAIKYGYEGPVSILKVQVESYVDANVLWITIRDNGAGMSEELRRSLQENFKRKNNTSGHIGLYNVHRRIFLMYGKDYGVTLESEPMKGTVVSLKLPVIDAEDSEKGALGC